MTACCLDVLRIIRVFGPCSNADVARRLRLPLHRTYAAIQQLTNDGYTVHPKKQAWDISPKGAKVFAAIGLDKPAIYQE